MNPVRIDTELCKRDGLCVSECPLGVLEIKEGEDIPSVNGRKARFCINCGHCAAICPANAISIAALGHRKAEPFRRKDMASAEEAALLFKTRRSIRSFKPEPLDEPQIERLINLSSYAPSGHNARPVSWSVLSSRDEVEQLTGLVVEWMEDMLKREDPLAGKLFLKGIVRTWNEGRDLICRQAPAIAVAWAPKTGITPESDAVLAAGYLELAAHSERIGACWAGYVTFAAQYSQKVRDFLGVDDGHMVHASILLGHSAVKYSNIPPRPEATPEKKGLATVFRAPESSH